MNKYNEQYYIALDPYGENQIEAMPDEKTFNRRYDYEKVPLGEAPFFFSNADKEEHQEQGVKSPLTDVLISFPDLIVNTKIREELIKYDILGLQIYPTVYIDDDDNWHENYWFLTFYEKFQYWDKKLSKISYDDDKYASVDKFCLDEKKLNAIAEEKRLMFKIKGADIGFIFVHHKIVDFIIKNKFNGVRFFKVSEFEIGMHNYPGGIGVD